MTMTLASALATMPKRIKVGPHRYEIRLVDSIDAGDTEATCDSSMQVIQITSRAPDARRVVCRLLHELLHAIWADRDLGKRAVEERAVLQFESGLTALLSDNPKLLAWITRGLQ